MTSFPENLTLKPRIPHSTPRKLHTIPRKPHRSPRILHILRSNVLIKKTKSSLNLRILNLELKRMTRRAGRCDDFFFLTAKHNAENFPLGVTEGQHPAYVESKKSRKPHHVRPTRRDHTHGLRQREPEGERGREVGVQRMVRSPPTDTGGRFQGSVRTSPSEACWGR